MTLLDQQVTIEQEIFSESIACTSEDWNRFFLKLSYKFTDDELGEVAVSLTDESGDFDTPSDGLFEAIHRLNKLFHRYGVAWVWIEYQIFLDQENKWNFSSRYQY